MNLLEEGKKYAFVGKPCDVTSLKLYMENDAFCQIVLFIFLSFFCAGQRSSLNAQKVVEADFANEEMYLVAL